MCLLGIALETISGSRPTSGMSMAPGLRLHGQVWTFCQDTVPPVLSM